MSKTELAPEDIRLRMQRRHICVVIPTFNNASTLEAVVRSALRWCSNVIVVNDGSTDATESILQNIDGIVVVTHRRNRGKGHALRSGFLRARELGFAYAITMDADGQHYAADLPHFLAANIAHPGALIVGQRRLDGIVRSKGSVFANRFSNFWFCVQTAHFLPDTQTGYRLYPLRHISGLGWLTSRYEAELELLVFSAWRGTPLVSIPVDVYYPPKEERVSHFRPAPDFTRISILNTVLCLLAVVYGYPAKLWRTVSRLLRTLYTMVVFIGASLCYYTPYTFFQFALGRITEKKRERLHRMIWRFARFAMSRVGLPGVTFRRRGNIEKAFDTPRIVICNHQSMLDLMALLSLTPKIVFLTKDWVWHNPFFGYLVRCAEYLPASEGTEALMPRLQSLKARGYSIVVFPEGTRSRDGRIGRFHKGAFYMAEQLKMDILPLLLHGASHIAPKGATTLRKGTITLEVGQSIRREKLAEMGTLLQQASAIRRKYKEWLSRVADKNESE